VLVVEDEASLAKQLIAALHRARDWRRWRRNRGVSASSEALATRVPLGRRERSEMRRRQEEACE